MKSHSFIPATDESLHYFGDWMLSSLPYTRFTRGISGEYVRLQAQYKKLYGVFHLHEWSGIVSIEVNGIITKEIDLFTPFPHDQRLLLDDCESSQEVKIRLISTGRKKSISLGSEVVIRGFDGVIRRQQTLSKHNTDDIVEDFTAIQSTHIDRWRAMQEEDRYLEISHERKNRYLQRYKRSSVFFGGRVLDIGCGYLYPEILELLASQGIEYHGIDVDTLVVDHCNNQLNKYKIHGSVRQGEIGTIKFDTDSYDTIFSSHTIEHSSNLGHSLCEIFRALRNVGNFILSVPIGWDDSEEHVHCYNCEEWIMYVREVGFDIVSTEIARLYDPSRYDITIIARKI